MDNFAAYILTAFALVFVIEGLLYTLFPDAMRRFMAMALAMPPQDLRRGGFIMVISGFFLVWLVEIIFF